MTFGDKIRQMDDEALASMLIDTIEANSDFFEEYRIDLGGYQNFVVESTEELISQLGEEIFCDE